MNTLVNKKRLDFLLESNPAIIYTSYADLRPGTTYISPNVERILGHKVEDFLNDPMFWIDNVHPEDKAAAKAQYPYLSHLGHWEREYRFRHKNGQYLWVNDHTHLAYDALGNATEMAGTMLVMTGQRKEIAALEKQQQLAQQYIEQVNSVFVILDDLGLITNINQYTANILGAKKQSLIGLDWFENFVPQDIRTELKWSFHASIIEQGAAIKNIEYPIISKTGEERIIIWKQFVSLSDEGKALFIASGEDMTENIIAQRKLKTSEELYRLIANNTNDVIRKQSDKGDLTFISPSSKKVLGYAPEEIVGKNLDVFLHPDELASLREDFQKILTTNAESHIATYQFKRKDGIYIWLETTSSFLYDDDGSLLEILSVSRDITHRMKLQREMEEMGALMQMMQQKLPLISFRTDAKGKLLQSIGHGLNRLGKHDHEDEGLNIHQFVPDINEFGALAKKQGFASFETHGNSKYGPWWFHNFLLNDQSNDGLIGISFDISDLKHAQAELHKTKEMYRVVVNSMPKMAVFVFDTNLRFYFAEGQDLTANNYKSTDIIGKTLFDLFGNSKKQPFYKPYSDALKGISRIFEHEAAGKVFQVHVTPLRNEAGAVIGAISISQDITERKQMEQLLIKGTIESNDKERKAFSLELHDGLGQQLSALKMQLESVDTNLFVNDKHQFELFEQSKLSINNILRGLRQLSNNLMPNLLEDFGLEAAIEELCVRTNKSKRVTVAFHSEGMDLETNYLTNVGIYRIIEELLDSAINNQLLVAFSILLVKKKKRLTLNIEKTTTNSDKIDYFENTNEFFNITSRTRALNGQMEIKNLTNHKTLISLTIPFTL